MWFLKNFLRLRDGAEAIGLPHPTSFSVHEIANIDNTLKAHIEDSSAIEVPFIKLAINFKKIRVLVYWGKFPPTFRLIV